MLYPIGYKDGEVVLNIGHTKTLSTYSFSQNPANTVVTEVDVPAVSYTHLTLPTILLV